MPDVESRVGTLPPPGRVVPRPASPHGGERASGTARRRLTVAAWLFGGDIVSGALATAIVLAGAAALIESADWLRPQIPVLLLLLTGSCCVVGLYRDRAAVRSPVERFRLRANAMLLFVFAGGALFLREHPLEALTIIPAVAVVALVLGLWIEHWTCTHLIRRGLWCAKAAMLGDAAEARALARQLRMHPEWGLEPVGMIDGGPETDANADGQVPAGDGSLPVLAMPAAHSTCGFEVLIVLDARALPADRTVLHRLGVERVLVMAQTHEFPTFGLHVRHFDGCVAFEVAGAPPATSPALKRAVDLTLSLPLALLFAPLVGLLALAIKFADPGSALYGQRRLGRDGKPIQVLKLRTMYRDAEARLQHVLEADPAARAQWQCHFKLPRDPRILPGIGEFLRRTSLDELPQIWNVIRGDMSLVGPRPFPAYHMDAFDPEFRALRLSVPPGLTGIWQISSRSDGDLAVQREQDCFYIRHRSLWLDLYVLMATLPAIIKGQGAK